MSLGNTCPQTGQVLPDPFRAVYHCRDDYIGGEVPKGLDELREFFLRRARVWDLLRDHDEDLPHIQQETFGVYVRVVAMEGEDSTQQLGSGGEFECAVGLEIVIEDVKDALIDDAGFAAVAGFKEEVKSGHVRGKVRNEYLLLAVLVLVVLGSR